MHPQKNLDAAKKKIDEDVKLGIIEKEIIARVPKRSECFAVFDCKHGYWQIELAN